MRPIVITRHAALVAYLRERGIVDADVDVVPHCDDPEMLRGRVVIGPIPMHLAAIARSVVHVPMGIPPELRGVELTLEQVRQYAGPPEEYAVLPQLRGYLTDREDRAAWLPYAPRAESALQAAGEILDAWAASHGLVDMGDTSSPETSPDDECAAAELVRLGRLPPPPLGRVISSLMLDGRPAVRATVTLRTASSTGAFVRGPNG